MSRSSNEGRIFAVEAAKFVAAYGVALIHLAPCTPQAELITNVVRLFPIYYFFASTVHFTVRRMLKNDGTIAGSLSLGRLIRPYAAWTILYILMHWSKNGAVAPANGCQEWLGLMFLGQSAVHLYFLPQLIYFQIVSGAAVLLFSYLLNKRFHFKAACWLGGAFVASFVIDQAGYFGWHHAFYTGLLYAFLGAVSVNLDKYVDRAWGVAILLASLLMIAFALIAGIGVELPSFYYFLNGPVFGCCTLLILLRMRLGVPPRWMERLVSCYFGIYLGASLFWVGSGSPQSASPHPKGS